MTNKGKRRIRLLGKGSDKALIMVTLCITEAGDVFLVQYIFGGKTERCHPKTAVPKGSIFCHRSSHSQTEDTLRHIEYIKGVFSPHKNEIMRTLNLPASRESYRSLIFTIHTRRIKYCNC